MGTKRRLLKDAQKNLPIEAIIQVLTSELCIFCIPAYMSRAYL